MTENEYLMQVDQVERFLRTRPDEGALPVAKADQVQAAASEAREIMDDLHEVVSMTDPGRLSDVVEGEAGDRGTAMVLAAVYMPWMSACPHVARSQITPILADMPARTVVCPACSSTRAEMPNRFYEGDADRCDFCGRDQVESFRPVALRAGQIMVAGDACDECGDAIASAFLPGT